MKRLIVTLACCLSLNAQALDIPEVDRKTRIVLPEKKAAAKAPAVEEALKPVQPLDGIVAVVNQDIITASDLATRVDLVLARIRAEGNTRPPPIDALQRQVLEHMIVERVQLQLAERSGIRVNEDAIDQAISNIAQQNGRSVEQLRQDLSKEGKDWGQFRQEAKTQITLARLSQREVDRHVNVTPDEENTLIKQIMQSDLAFDLQHILLALPEDPTPEQITEKQGKAESLRQRLLAGEDFGQLAIAESQGQSALQNGRIGAKKPGELPPDFISVFKMLNPGDISPVLRTSSGFHLFKLLAKVNTTAAQIKEVHARHILIQAKTPEALRDADKRLQRLRQQILQSETDFAQAAKSHSEDPGSAEQGGDLGWVGPGQMVPEFERAMMALKTGDISQPVRSNYGMHLIQALDTRERQTTEADQRNEARAQIFNRKISERTEQWLRELRDGAYVKVLAPDMLASDS